MKLLKYILLFLFSFLLNINISAKEIVIVENQNVFFEVIHNQTVSKEHTWLGLLYLQENSKLVTSNDKTVLSCMQIFLSVNPNLIDSWKLLSDIPNIRTSTNFLEGSMFVADAVRRYGDDFPPGTLFEFTEVTAGGVRRVDVRVGNTFYEFKSVASVPPSGFATQFAKDLSLNDVTGLNQLKWWFDGNKVSSLPKQQFLDALDNMNLDQIHIDKFFPGQTNVPLSDLVDLIDNSFTTIFSVK